MVNSKENLFMDELSEDELVNCLNLINNGESLKNLPKKFSSNKEIVLHAITKTPRDLEFVSDSLQNDRDIIFTAVSNGIRLERIPVKFRNDKEIVLIAIKKFPFNFQQASLELKEDPDVIITALNNRISMGFIKSQLIFVNNDVIFAALKNNPNFYRTLPEEKQNDVKIVMEAIKCGLSLSTINKKFCDDKKIMLVAVQTNGFNIDFASNELKNDPEIVFTALKQNILAVHMIMNQPIFKEDLIIFKMCHSEIPNFFSILPRDILFEIGMKMKKFGLFETELIEILQFLIDNHSEEDFFYKESCFEIALIYWNGRKKNFKKTKKYLKESIEKKHKIEESHEKLHQLEKFLSGLNNKEIKTLETCSNGENYEILKRLAKSSEATIFKVKRKSDNLEFVMKRFEINDMQFNNALKEVILLMKLQHPHVCEIIDFFVETNELEDDEEIFTFSIIMPFYQSDLHEFISKNENLNEKVC